MAIQLFYSSYNPILNNNGDVAVGAKLEFYDPGTVNFKSTYSDPAASIPNTNPVITDANGRATIYLSGDYDLVIKDALDNVLVTLYNIAPDSAGSQSGVNLVENGSFEINTIADGKTPDAWTLTEYAGSTTTLSSDSATGSKAFKSTSTGSGGANVLSEDFFEVAGGDILTASWFMKSSVAGVRNLVQIQWYDSGQSFISSSTLYDNSVSNPTSYTRQIVTATAPSTARFAKMQFYAAHPSDATPGDTFYDGVELIPSSVGGGFASGTRLVFSQAAAPSGWTFPAETQDWVAMFGNLTGDTTGGSWTITNLSANSHTHGFTAIGAVADTQTWAQGSGALGANGYYWADNPQTYTFTGTASNTGGPSTSVVTHSPGWRPQYRVVKVGVKS